MLNRYYSTDAEDGAEIKVYASYTLGGGNVWTGSTDPRGYYLYVQRVKREGNMESFMLFDGSGFKVLLKEVTRKSKKAEAEADALATEKADEYATKLAEKLGLTIEAVAA